MDELLRFLRLEGGQEQVLPLWEVLAALMIAFLCSVVIAQVYRATHRSPGYSQSYVQTLVLTSVVTTVIMIIIGSNIARAFSLVGALSIIRFRNAVKETRDIGYIFFSMAVAMAAGTRFYAIALLATGVICSLMLLLSATRFGASRDDPERLLRVRLPAGTDPLATLEGLFQTLFSSYSMILVETVQQGTLVDAVFSVRQAAGVTAAQVLERISQVNGNLKVSYHYALGVEDV